MKSTIALKLQQLNSFMLRSPFRAIVLFSILSRLFVIALYWKVTIFPDSESYSDLAKLLLHFNIAGYDGERTPGYPLVLAMANNWLPLVVVYQMLLGIVTAIYLFKTLRVLQFSTIASLYITLLLNSMVHVIFYETAILTEVVIILLVTVSFYHILKLLHNGQAGYRQVFVISLLLGLLTFVKPFFVFMPFIVYGLYTLKDFSFSKIFNRLLILPFFSLIAFLGWSYVNKVNTGYFVSTTYYGITTAQNCVYFAEKTPEKYHLISSIYVKYREQAIAEDKDVAMSIWYAHAELTEKTGLNFVDLSHELNEFATVAIIDNPADYAKQVFISWKDFWKTSIYWNYNDFNVTYANKVFLEVWYIQSFILVTLKIIFVLLIPYHIFLFFKNKKITPQFIIVSFIFSASLLQAMATYGTNSRYSYPFEFLMIICVLTAFKPQLKRLLA
ncbi:hypothetical protein Q765_04655 [Flavobacterium rivuli WB 3.3-2 = DSM 21788]|uniref:Glycosyltransferase RgtA/B/C/D-like domain-containing protein n=1 Tax=Flavobacterium rivuli WB 3.3-2 = DSM 21788 TaxID=1121895 RepID=A0A0A2M843_9FLAO|nr:hypothetical protein [Flavobacterium rivuli]KGO87786.1 hypothetical protein Q765_04655 [Flavobacterium rivuli WB 3.3-2 = DSM 21788]